MISGAEFFAIKRAISRFADCTDIIIYEKGRAYSFFKINSPHPSKWEISVEWTGHDSPFIAEMKGDIIGAFTDGIEIPKFFLETLSFKRRVLQLHKLGFFIPNKLFIPQVKRICGMLVRPIINWRINIPCISDAFITYPTPFVVVENGLNNRTWSSFPIEDYEYQLEKSKHGEPTPVWYLVNERCQHTAEHLNLIVGVKADQVYDYIGLE